MKKLTPAQRRILERLIKGNRLHWMTGIHAGAFWGSNIVDRAPRTDSVLNLARDGFIAQGPGWDWRGGIYIITEAGKAAWKA